MKRGVRGGKYVFEYDVGLSTFGSVQVYKDRQAGVLRTCKTVPKSSLRNPSEVLSRLSQLQALKHLHVAGIVEVVEESASLFIVSEYCAGGDIDDWVGEVQRQECNTCIDEATCCAYTRQALLALVYCEQKNVIHGDLRPSSLLLTTKQYDAAVKVADFGLATALDPDRTLLRSHVGPYTAPEVIDGSSPLGSGAPDVWSLGAIAHALLVGEPPERQRKAKGGMLAGMTALLSTRGDGWAERSPMSRDFVHFLLQPAAQRPTASAALQHPWLKALMPSGPQEIIQDVPSKMLCYMLAVLLVPTLLPHQDFERLQLSFVQTDTDGDGLVAQQAAQRLLQVRSMTKEAALASLEIADVGGTGVYDLCAVTVADLLGREFMVNGPLQAADLSQRCLRRFFDLYGDQRQTVTALQIRGRVRTGTSRDMEYYCGVNYDQVLENFPANCPVTSKVLAAQLINCAGQGTPLGGSVEEKDEDDLGQLLGIDAVDAVIGGIFKACGLSRVDANGKRMHPAHCI